MSSFPSLLAITEEIVFDGLGHTAIATLPGMAEGTITISGISKSYSVCAHGGLGRTKIRFCFPKTDDMLRDAGKRFMKLRQ